MESVENLRGKQMDDDIVTQLQNLADACDRGQMPECTAGWIREAADEIEDLREALSKWQDIAYAFAESTPQHKAFAMLHEETN
jgi:hypothetical protein